MSQEKDRAKEEQERRLRELGLRGNPDNRPVCIHCGNRYTSHEGSGGLCPTCTG